MATGVKNRTGIVFDLVWENPHPSSDFSAQTVPLDLSDYDMVMIECKMSSSGTSRSEHFCRVGNMMIMQMANLAGSNYIYKRQATVSTSGVTFTTGYRTTTDTTGASYLTPVAIYGIKGVPA